MTALNRFALDILMDVAGAPVDQVERAARFAAIEFCDYSLAWRLPLADVPIVAETNEYDLTPPANSRVVTVFHAAQDGIRLLPTTEMSLDDAKNGWRSADVTADKAAWYYLPDRTKIRLALTPEIVGNLSLTVALKPTQDARALPDFLYEDHLEAIRHGVLARLLAQPGKEYSDPNLAGFHLGAFEAAKRKEKAERYNDYTRRSTLSVTPHAYAGRRRGNCED